MKRGGLNCKHHTDGPAGYIAWRSWAEEMAKTHVQFKCRECGLYKIWRPKRRLGMLEGDKR